MCVGEMISVDKVLCFFKCEDFFFYQRRVFAFQHPDCEN